MSLNAGSEQFGLMVGHGRVEEYISWAEAGLRAVLSTPYHAVIGQSFDDVLPQATDYLIATHREAAGAFAPKALYFEMNGFEINPDRWYFSGFAYRNGGDIWSPEWLADWDYHNPHEVTVTGMETVQRAFAEHYLPRDGEITSLHFATAASIAMHLVCARYIHLIAQAHAAAKHRYPALMGLPVIATAHDWDSMAQTA